MFAVYVENVNFSIDKAHKVLSEFNFIIRRIVSIFIHELFSTRVYLIVICLDTNVFQHFSGLRAIEEKRRVLVFIHSIFCFICTQALDRYPPGVYI